MIHIPSTVALDYAESDSLVVFWISVACVDTYRRTEQGTATHENYSLDLYEGTNWKARKHRTGFKDKSDLTH